jgi:hypothetical protein
MELGITGRIGDIDWAERWRAIVRQRSGSAQPDPTYWDRRAPSYARITRDRKDDFLRVVEPYASPRKTLIDAGAGAGRHAVALAERLEWVTAVEPSEGMRAQIPPRDNMTVIASTWQDAEGRPGHLLPRSVWNRGARSLHRQASGVGGRPRVHHAARGPDPSSRHPAS